MVAIEVKLAVADSLAIHRCEEHTLNPHADDCLLNSSKSDTRIAVTSRRYTGNVQTKLRVDVGRRRCIGCRHRNDKLLEVDGRRRRKDVVLPSVNPERDTDTPHDIACVVTRVCHTTPLLTFQSLHSREQTRSHKLSNTDLTRTLFFKEYCLFHACT